MGPSPFQFGMEIEISGHQGLRNLVPYFEMRSESPAQERMILETSLTPEEIDSYLTPENFKLLPVSMQQKLTEGLEADPVLNIDPKPIIVPKPQAAPTGILASARATPVPQVNRSAGGIILTTPSTKPTEVANAPGELIIPQIVKQEVKWNKILQRWKNLDQSTRLSRMSIEGLPANKKATLWMGKKIPQNWIKPKKTNSPEVAELLSNLEWEATGGLIEFRHKTPVNGHESYLRNVELFSEMAGIKRYINDPNTVFPPEPLRYTYHVHTSRRGASLDGVADRLNKILLIKMYNEGRGEGAVKSSFGFAPVARKGLMRLVAKDRIEYRSHVESPRAELERYMPYMARPASEVEPELDREIAVGVAKVREDVKAHLAKTTNSPFKFDASARDEHLAFLTRILTNLDRRIAASDLPSLVGVDLKSALGQARLLRILETSQDTEDLENVLPLLTRNTVETQFANLIPLTERMGRSKLLVLHAQAVGIDSDRLHREIKTAAIEFFEANRNVKASQPFSRQLLEALPAKDRTEIAKYMIERGHPRQFHLLKPAFSGLGDVGGPEIARLVLKSIQTNAEGFRDFEIGVLSIMQTDANDPFHTEMKIAYDKRAFGEKTTWRSSDYSLIDRLSLDQKEVLFNILKSDSAVDSTKQRAFERIMALGIPLREIPLKEYFDETTPFQTRFKALTVLLTEAEKSSENREIVLAHLRSIDLEELMLYAHNHWHKFESTSVLRALAFEAVKKPPTASAVELVDYLTWANTEVYKDPTAMKQMTALIEGSSNTDWDSLLAKNLYRFDHKYFGDGSALSERDKQAVVDLLERSFRDLGNDASDAAFIYQAIQNEPKLQTEFGSSILKLRPMHVAFEANRNTLFGCSQLFRNLKSRR